MFILNDKRKTRIRHYWLYAIALEQGKYYVGITAWGDPYIRLKQHGGPAGARWTKKYKPVKPVVPLALEDLGRITHMQAEIREQQKFEEFVKEYGLKNVRGGRIISSGNVYKIGGFYLNQSMLETLGVALLLMLCGIVLTFGN